MPFSNLIIHQQERICTITINRESKLNALNAATLAELHTALKQAFSDEQVGGIIITGAGLKAFVAGADIAEFTNLSPAQGQLLAHNAHQQVFNFIANAPKPIIAAVNGFALGGGLELAMACHLRVAADTARMGLPEVTLGLIPGYGGTQRLSQLVGKGRALELILTAEMVNAQQALQMGLVNHICPPADLLNLANSLMGKILSRAPLAIAAAIKAVNAGYTDGVDGYQAEIDAFGQCFGTADFKEGVDAFLNKRPAAFKGR